MADQNLDQIVKEPTRKDRILDLIFTSIPDLVEKCKVAPGISDHDGMPVADIGLHPQQNTKAPRSVPLYNKADWEKIQSDLSEAEETFFQNSPAENTVTENWLFLKDCIQTTIKKNIPHKTIKGKQTPPWITRDIRREMKRKQRAYNKARKSNNERDWANFRKRRKGLQQNIRNSYWDHVNRIVDPSASETGSDRKNSKGLWRFLKSTRRDNSGIGTLKANGISASSAESKAEMLNSQFCSVFTHETKDLPPSQDSPHPAMPKLTIGRKGVENLLEKIDPSKAPGPDDIPGRVLKTCASQISAMLTFIFQQSLDTGEVPRDWREANVVPLFKKGERTKPSNYRPVSLTSLCCKLLEHIVVSKIMDHLDNHNILVEEQHGFRSKRSCESQLIITCHDLVSELNRKGQVDMAVLDFAKAFDKVPHRRLATRLDYYGIRGKTKDWIQAFLRDRRQQVVIDGFKSKPSPVTSGVPQGTVLGPLLFLIFINNIGAGLHPGTQIRLFADDCLIYRTIKSKRDAEILQDDLNHLVKWSRTWQMAFNVDKCSVLTVTNARRKKLLHEYNMNGQTL